MARSINNVKSEPVILCDPCLQTASWVEHGLFGGILLPSDTFDVLFCLHIGHLRVHIASEE